MSNSRVKGFRKKPLWIPVLAGIYFLIPAATFFQMASQAQFSPGIAAEILRSDYFLFEWFAGWSSAAAVLLVTRLSFVYFVGLGVYVSIARVMDWLQYPMLASPIELAAGLVWVILTAVFLFSYLNVPYLNPRTRWWTQAERLSTIAIGSLRFEAKEYPIVTLNLSEGGMLVKLDERKTDQQNPLGSILGKTVAVNVLTDPAGSSVYPDKRFELPAEVVWVSKPGSQHRSGLGLRFLFPDRASKEAMRRYIRLLRASGHRPGR